jgi:hypothetical protein
MMAGRRLESFIRAKKKGAASGAFNTANPVTA